ncbi:nucleotide pyrophosphohydrolase [Methylobacterium sp. WL6]|uniref:nucleotide pyrophosphohydrolase n=1 Tax=Methylobacterium sp. WL6 TaxID=2603901 RepID=UPI001AEDF089|nr:nucleotide pyrophosphohydrolase [Methylobacterium sp. WL6]
MEELIEQLLHFRDERDWGQFHKPKDLAISVSIEAAELLEIFQWRPDGAEIDEALVVKVKDEAADILLYLTLLCNSFNIDLLSAAKDKLARNSKRFPASSSRGIPKPQDETTP